MARLRLRTKKNGLAALVLAAATGLFLTGPALAQDGLEDIKIIARASGALKELIGRDLNGTDFSGRLLDGRKVAWIALQPATQAGEALQTVWLHEGELQAIAANNRRLRHNALRGVTFEGQLDDCSPLSIRIADVDRLREPGLQQVYTYLATYRAGSGEWEPLCGRSADGSPVWALALNGHWNLAEGVAGGGSWLDDPARFTFACQGHVLAKCVEAGYPPWRTARVCGPVTGCERITLAAHHQACTRLLRADYCGDGKSHTLDETWVNLYDLFGIRVDSDAWTFEAEWDAGGATCINHLRLPGLPGPAPDCLEHLIDEDCGNPDHFWYGSLLFSEIQADQP